MIVFCAMEPELFSLRMRSSRGGKHISGAERLLDFSQLEAAASGMLGRALKHSRGRAEKISLNLQEIPAGEVQRKELLPLSTIVVETWQQGRQRAAELLVDAGILPAVARAAIAVLAAGPSPAGGSMRGAMLMDAQTGERLEPDAARGLRVSRMDVDPASRQGINDLFGKLSIDSPRATEAWVLASKVALCPQIIAELCWSDDPDYLTGYVASTQNGYQRVTRLKESGSEIGGRVFFVQPATDLKRLTRFLQHEPILFNLAPLQTS